MENKTNILRFILSIALAFCINMHSSADNVYYYLGTGTAPNGYTKVTSHLIIPTSEMLGSKQFNRNPLHPNRRDTVFITGSTNTLKVVVENKPLTNHQSGINILLKNVQITSTTETDFGPNGVKDGGGGDLKTGSCFTIVGKNGQYNHNSYPPSPGPSMHPTDAEKNNSTVYPNLDPQTKVNIILDGTNDLDCKVSRQGTNHELAGFCAIQVDLGAQLHIKAIDDNTSRGILTAQSQASGAAIGAIGANHFEPNDCESGFNLIQGSCRTNSSLYAVRGMTGGNIIISSGKITAKCLGGHGAGIGGGFRTFYDGSIIVTGGDVTSINHLHGAGLGSGCPIGDGIRTNEFAPHGAVIVLPPAKLDAYSNQSPNVNRDTKDDLGGMANMIHATRSGARRIKVHTEDYLPNANIYIDISDNLDIMAILARTYKEFDPTHILVGRTPDHPKGDTRNYFEFNASFQDEVTFYTDATDESGKPYTPEDRSWTGTKSDPVLEIILKKLPINIHITEYPSFPLFEGYSASEAKMAAQSIKIEYLDQTPMKQSEFGMFNACNSLFTPIYFHHDSTEIGPASGNNCQKTGFTFQYNPSTGHTDQSMVYVALPLVTGKPAGIYSEMFRFKGNYQNQDIAYIRKITSQVIMKDDISGTYITMDAGEKSGSWDNPTTLTPKTTFNLSLYINHRQTPPAYEKSKVQAYYIITTEKNYADAQKTPITQWNKLNAPASEGGTATTPVQLGNLPGGTYYIHWYVSSGILGAHSHDYNGPIAENQAFGPYVINRLKANPDPYTVQLYHGIEMDVLDNDFHSGTPELEITTQPLAGNITILGKNTPAQKLYYTNTGTGAANKSITPNYVDSFQYKIKEGTISSSAWVYIYVVEDRNGAAGYTGQKYEGRFNHAGNVTFDIGQAIQGGNFTGENTGDRDNFTIPNLQTEFIFDITPIFKKEEANNKNYYGILNQNPIHPDTKWREFPKARFTVYVNGSQSNPGSFRWTGNADTLWKNPNNWVEIARTAQGISYEKPARHAPTRKSNVTISSNVNNFPVLTDSVDCAGILMKDRAMLKDPHYLRYDSAKVEIKLLPEKEMGRYIMWSAPLNEMYSGDYHFPRGGAPSFGDIRMNLFQQENPDYPATGPNPAVEKANHFTATFASLTTPLPLGRAFNINVTATTMTKGQTLTFPKYDNKSYQGVNVNKTPLAKKFITDTVKMDSRRRFNMPVYGNMNVQNTSYLIQVVNPYMAYLNMEDFIRYNNMDDNGNPVNNFHTGYYIWDGDINNDFNTVAFINGNRILVNKSDMATAAGAQMLLNKYIPPLQSFFIYKYDPTKTITSVKMSPEWTTTTAPIPNILRGKEIKSGGVLNIKATQDDSESYAALVYEPYSNPGLDQADLPAIFYKDNSLEIYTIAAGHALSVNTNGYLDIATQTAIPLGIRTKDAGNIKLEFYGLETFGYDVYLTDKELNKEILINTSPEYSFHLSKQGSDFIEINDRFTLHMSYTGKGLDTEDAKYSSSTPDIQIWSSDKEIHIQSASPIKSISIYNAIGSEIYEADDLNLLQATIPVPVAQQLYIVNIRTERGSMAKRIFLQ